MITLFDSYSLNRKAAKKIQITFRNYLNKQRNQSSDVIGDFLRIALSARALHIGKWAANTLAQYSNLCKYKYKQRKAQELEEEWRLNGVFRRKMAIQSVVHEHIEIGCMNVLETLLKFEQDNKNSFFITQKSLQDESELELDQWSDCLSDKNQNAWIETESSTILPDSPKSLESRHLNINSIDNVDSSHATDQEVLNSPPHKPILKSTRKIRSYRQERRRSKVHTIQVRAMLFEFVLARNRY